jgi:hypothetical protein
MRKSIALCLLSIPLAHAAPGPLPKPPSDADFCRNGAFAREQDNLSLGVVTGRTAEKVHFFGDLDGCPTREAKCMRPAYLVPGDEILVSKTTADWACVWYQGRQHESVSWIPKQHVLLRPAAPIRPLQDWVGRWIDGPNEIRISAAKSDRHLQIVSELRWEGGTLANGEPITHFGGIAAALHVDGPKARAESDGCQVRLTRIGQYLVADDNGACGGMNVRHTGMYFRQSH